MRFVLAAMLSLLALAFPAVGQQQETQPSLEDQWDSLLRDHTQAGIIDGIDLVLVDYGSIAKDTRWAVLLSALETAPEPEEKNGKIAFWTNAYNILAIDVVAKNYPLKSIRDAGGWFRSVWKMDAGVVAGKMRSLDEIEHQILRPLDPRIHGAVVCASVSCPDLRREAFRAETIDEQLDDQMRQWMANTGKGVRLDGDGRTLYISHIFKWFEEDFGGSHDGVLRFITPYLPSGLAGNLPGDVRVRYIDYDWSLNDLKRSE